MTVGNDGYSFCRSFHLDGTIELEAKANRIPFPSGHDRADPTPSSATRTLTGK